MSEEQARQRVRILYAKGELIKFISHQDEFRLWERTLRRADLPLLYKQGFNPQPHIQFAAPLGVGITGVQECIDVTFSPPVPLAELAQRIAAKLPPGTKLHGVEEVPLNTSARQTHLIGADYTIRIYAEPDEISGEELQARLDEFLTADMIPRTRQRKGSPYTYNLRPLVLDLTYVTYCAELEEHRIFLRVQQRAGATGRPDEVVDALGLDEFARSLCRDRLYFDDNADDVACFAPYPVILQETIMISQARPRGKPTPPSRGRAATPVAPAAGRSISERAGDEFG